MGDGTYLTDAWQGRRVATQGVLLCAIGAPPRAGTDDEGLDLLEPCLAHWTAVTPTFTTDTAC